MEWDDFSTLGSEEERFLRTVTEDQDIYFDGNVDKRVILPLYYYGCCVWSHGS